MKLKATKREITGSKVKNLRKEDIIPAVLYGKGIDSVNISLNAKDFYKIYKDAGESTVLELEIEKGDPKNVLIYSVSHDPLSDDIIHADLYEVNMKKEVSANVPLVFIGESQAEKEGGVLVKSFHELEVVSLPKDLPHEIEIDLSLLETIEDTIKITDLKLPSSVKVSIGEDDLIVSVVAPRSQEEIEALSEDVAPANIEGVKVESEEKKDKEESTEKEK